jgi:hypothetical protein
LIIYQASKSQFLHHAFREDIEDVVSVHFRSATGHGVGPSEIQSWKHSLLEMAKVLQDEEIPDDAGVAIEYQLPQSSKRIDFVITGRAEGDPSLLCFARWLVYSPPLRGESYCDGHARTLEVP